MQEDVDNNCTYKIDEIVWGKVCGYPWWPGVIISFSEKQYEVLFFFEFSKSFLSDKKIKKFTNIEPKNLHKKDDLKIAYEQALDVMHGRNTLENFIEERELKLQEKSEIEKQQVQEVSNSKTVTDSIEKPHEEFNVEQSQVRLKRYQSVQILQDDKQFFQQNSSDSFITSIENNIKDLLKIIKNEDMYKKENQVLFQSLFEVIMEQDNQKVYESQIGKFLKLLIKQVEMKISQDLHYQRLLDILNQGLSQVQKKLIEGFFNYKNVDCNNTQKFKRIKKIKKTKIVKNKLKKKKEKKKLKQTQPQVDKKEQDLKVKKKIAESLLKQVQSPINKQKVEELTEKIEEHLAKNSQNQEQYQEKFLKIIKNLQEKKLEFLNEDFKDKEISSIIEKINNQKKISIKLNIKKLSHL